MVAGTDWPWLSGFAGWVWHACRRNLRHRGRPAYEQDANAGIRAGRRPNGARKLAKPTGSCSRLDGGYRLPERPSRLTSPETS